MIEINGNKFAKNDNEFTDSLFHPGGTCKGYYKIHKKNIVFLNMQKEPFACLVNNRFNEQFFVSCYVEKQNNRNVSRFMFGLNSLDEKTLGLENSGWIESHKIAERIVKELY